MAIDQDDASPKMVFGGDEFQERKTTQAQTPKIIEWVMMNSGGYIKTENQANYFLIGFVAVACVISIFLLINSGSEPQVNPVKKF